LHPQIDGMGYKLWQQLMLDEPAAPIRAFDRQTPNNNGNSIKIWAFGYDMDNMKARCWYETTMPYYTMLPEIRPQFVEAVKNYLDCNKQILKYLYVAFKDTAVRFKTVELQFWHVTEIEFYKTLQKTIDLLIKDQHNDLVQMKEAWLSYVQDKATKLFDKHVNLQHMDLARIQKIMNAKIQFKKIVWGPKIRKEMGLNAKKGT
jgi:CRISPR system Cascade subunit CasA